jgi:glycosyltransferase involved in cell wall biosynthesis
VITSPLQKFPGASGRLRRHYLPLMPWAVEGLAVQPCDLLISTSSAVMKSIIPPKGVPHLCYCHSPARYIWEQGDDYAQGEGGLLRAAGLKALRRRFQAWDKRTADRVTQFIANSSHTAERIRRCYGRDSVVIYPPVRTEYFTPDQAVAREDWYLVVSALEPYKRTDLVIDAAFASGFKLKIAGDGSQRTFLERKVQRGNGFDRIEFVGRVSDEQLRELYRRAKALIFPQVEDFGIIAAEAQACGCPVIAFAGGGALDIVTARTGEFFKTQSHTSVCEAIERFRRQTIDQRDCRANALRFSERSFDSQIKTQVEALLGPSPESESAIPGKPVALR